MLSNLVLSLLLQLLLQLLKFFGFQAKLCSLCDQFFTLLLQCNFLLGLINNRSNLIIGNPSYLLIRETSLLQTIINDVFNLVWRFTSLRRISNLMSQLFSSALILQNISNLSLQRRFINISFGETRIASFRCLFHSISKNLLRFSNRSTSFQSLSSFSCCSLSNRICLLPKLRLLLNIRLRLNVLRVNLLLRLINNRSNLLISNPSYLLIRETSLLQTFLEHRFDFIIGSTRFYCACDLFCQRLCSQLFLQNFRNLCIEYRIINILLAEASITGLCCIFHCICKNLLDLIDRCTCCHSFSSLLCCLIGNLV